MTYAEFLRRHGLMASFGYALALTSSFGQTFFISLSGPDIREAFGLSNTNFGAIYSAATLASGLLMIWAGGVLDRVSTRAYAMAGLAGLSGAALSLSLAHGVGMLAFSLFALRFFGQGMLGHAAVTSAARLPSGVRGRAVGLATLGFPTGEAILPVAALAIIASFGWTVAWKMAAAFPLIALLLVLWLRPGADEEPHGHPGAARAADEKAPTRLSILCDRSFLIFLPALMGPSAVMTGYLFYQRHFAAVKAWPIEVVALSLPGYALASVTCGVLMGFAVDRFGGIRMSRFHLLGLLGSSLVLALGSGPIGAPLFFVLMGCTSGANNVVVPAVLAELYGTRHLGMIRALGVSMMVFASAATPVIFGVVIDAGVGVMTLGVVCAAYLGVSTVLNMLLRPRGSGEGAP